MSYAGGVFKDARCNGRDQVNHAVALVGYGTDEKYGDYFILRNSWGTEWG